MNPDRVTLIRRNQLLGVLARLCPIPRAVLHEVSEAMRQPGTAALEQLAAQYGLLKPGTQGAT